MVIPASFKLFNQTIKVVFKRNLIDKEEAFGVWHLKKNTIYLQQSTKKHVLNQEQITSTFIHEMLHACLDLMGEHKLSDNEVFVSSLSNLLHQFIVEVEDVA